MAGGMHGRGGCVWQGGMHGRGHVWVCVPGRHAWGAWQGECMAGAAANGMHGRGACILVSIYFFFLWSSNGLYSPVKLQENTFKICCDMALHTALSMCNT